MTRDEDLASSAMTRDWADPDRLLYFMGHAVIATDLGGRIVRWNPAAERLYGWTAEEILGRNIADVTVSEAGQEHGDDIMQSLREGRPWSGGFTVVRKDGSTFPALVTDAGVRTDEVGWSASWGCPRTSVTRCAHARPLLGRGPGHVPQRHRVVRQPGVHPAVRLVRRRAFRNALVGPRAP